MEVIPIKKKIKLFLKIFQLDFKSQTPISPFPGSSAEGMVSSALMPQITIVSPSLTIADPLAVEIGPKTYQNI